MHRPKISPSSLRPTLLAQIHTELDALHLAHWYPVLAEWLSHYDCWTSLRLGKKRLIMDDVPLQQLLEELSKLHRRESIDDEALAQACGCLPCLNWRARIFGEDEKWDSTREPLSALLQRSSDVEVWQYELPYPDSAHVRAWLLAQLASTRTAANV